MPATGGAEAERRESEETLMNDDNSLGGEATYAGKAAASPQRADVSLGDERTLGGGDAAGLDTVIDDIEVVDLEARYKIEGTLGQGGMGAVLLATDTRLGRKVAIKRILGEAARSKTAIMRFLTEAKAIAALNHPNIVQIHDYGRATDGPFLIMEYVDGGSLLDKCRESALPLDEAIDLACQLCDGLAKAHALGIIHRDIKPANVLLTKDGLPKLTDFGLAKAQASDHGHTMTGAVLGTPDFMPPEQRRDAAEVDQRSDLWSLAATVYQMVTGRSPKIIRFDLLPAELTKVLGKALEDAKDARYRSARELRDALRDAFSKPVDPKEPQRLQEPKADIESGECPKCHVRNDLQRKFCRECATSLRSACLSCEQQIPVWDKVCPECGKKQPELLAAWCEKLNQLRKDAEASLRGLGYEEAIAIAQEANVPDDDRFTDYLIWRKNFIGEAKAGHHTAIMDRTDKIELAKRHRAAFDYKAAIYALESIPEQLRFGEGSQLLATLRADSDEASSLLATLRARIDSKQLDEMVPLVQRAMQLRGDRKDLPTLLDRLIDREALLASREQKQRDWVAATFHKAIDTFNVHGEAKAALDILLPLRRLLTPQQDKKLDLMQEAVAAEQRLGELLALAKADGKIKPPETVDLAHAVVKCLSLVPQCQRVLAFRDQLLSHILKTPDQFAAYKTSLQPFFATLSPSALENVSSELLEVAKAVTPADVPTRGRDAPPTSEASRDTRVARPRETSDENDLAVEGRCPSCGTTHMDLTRKFCRKCGFSKTCRKCRKPMPVWDKICGDCGGTPYSSPVAHVRALARERSPSEKVRCPACGAECRADRIVQHFKTVHFDR